MNFIAQNDIRALKHVLPFDLPNMLTTLEICKRQTFLLHYRRDTHLFLVKRCLSTKKTNHLKH